MGRKQKVYYDKEHEVLERFTGVPGDDRFKEIAALGGVSIYTDDGELTGDRTVDLNGHSFRIRTVTPVPKDPFLTCDPTPGAEDVLVQAFNDATVGKYGAVECSTTDTDATTTLYADYGMGEIKDAYIKANATATTATLEYEADAHTFEGRVKGAVKVEDDFADDAAAAIGGIEVEGFYHTSGTVKIRLV